MKIALNCVLISKEVKNFLKLKADLPNNYPINVELRIENFKF